MKKIFLIFMILNSLMLADLIDEHFGKKLEVGIKAFQSKELYLKNYDGLGKIKYNQKEIEIKENTVIKIIFKGNNLLINGEKTQSISLMKKDIITIWGLSKDNKKFDKYRGEFRLIPYKTKIMPINLVFAEEYLYSVVPSEIGFNFPDEAIKAQALAARTYLYHGLENKKFEKFDMLDDTTSQMYVGYKRENKKIRKLINETVNEIITYENKPINALYHSTSGGNTANNEDVWKSNPISYLRSVDDKDNSKKAPRANWNYKISQKEISRKFRFSVNEIKVIEEKNNRVKKVLIKGEKVKKISGDDLRKIIGYTKIFSTVFKVKKSGNYFVFNGHGSGHGVGMSQWGAYGLAEKGYSYKEILKYYYKKIEIKKVGA